MNLSQDGNTSKLQSFRRDSLKDRTESIIEVNSFQICKSTTKLSPLDLLKHILLSSFDSRMQFLEERDKEIGLLIDYGYSVQSSIEPLHMAVYNHIKSNKNISDQKLGQSSKSKLQSFSKSKNLYLKGETVLDHKRGATNTSVYNDGKQERELSNRRKQPTDVINRNASSSRRNNNTYSDAHQTMSPYSSASRTKLNLKINNQDHLSKRSQASSINKERPNSGLRTSHKIQKANPTPLKLSQTTSNKEKDFDKCDFDNISYINTNDNLSQMSGFSSSKDQRIPRKKTPLRQAKDTKSNNQKDNFMKIEDYNPINQAKDTKAIKSVNSNTKSLKGSSNDIQLSSNGPYNAGPMSIKGRINLGRLSRNSSKEKNIGTSNNNSTNLKSNEKRVLHSLIATDLRRNRKDGVKLNTLNNEESFLNVSTILQVNDIITKDRLNEEMLISNINDSFSIQNTSQVFLNRVSNHSLNNSIIKIPHSTKSSIDLGFFHYPKTLDGSVKPFSLDYTQGSSAILNKLVNNSIHLYNTKCLKYLSTQDLISLSSVNKKSRKLIYGFYVKEKMNEINFLKNLYSKITLQTDGLNNIDTFQKIYVYNDAAKQALKLLNEENCVLAFKEQLQKGFSQDSLMLFKIILILILGIKSTTIDLKNVVPTLNNLFQESNYRMGLVISSAVDKRSSHDFWALKKIFFFILGRESSINPHNFSKTCATSGLISVFLKDLLGNFGLIYDVKANNIKSHIEFVVKLLHILEEEKNHLEKIYKSLN